MQLSWSRYDSKSYRVDLPGKITHQIGGGGVLKKQFRRYVWLKLEDFVREPHTHTLKQ